jgi:hypothetical protein
VSVAAVVVAVVAIGCARSGSAGRRSAAGTRSLGVTDEMAEAEFEAAVARAQSRDKS